MISSSQIDKIGDKLRKEASLTSEESLTLLDWRNSFVSTLDYYHRRSLQKIQPETLLAVGKRLKRIPSIQKKLLRSKTLRLSSMQDIAGLRLILKSQNDLQVAVNAIRSSESKNKFIKFQDYHSRPKQDGYRSVHLVYRSLKYNKLIELQLRTELEHIWATAVEVYGSILNSSFKTGEGDLQWREFFRLLSSYIAINENGHVLEEHLKLSSSLVLSRLKKIMNKLKVIEHLSVITNSIDTVVKTHSKGKMGKYALIELDIEAGKTTVDIYTKKDIRTAIAAYTEKEFDAMKTPQKNIVFANIDSIESLHQAYPNYFLDTEKLIRILGQIALGHSISLS